MLAVGGAGDGEVDDARTASWACRGLAVGRDVEDFELLNTASLLRRAARHAFAFDHGAIPEQECLGVARESYDLLMKTARIKCHVVPLAERWSLDRLRRVGRPTRRLEHTVPEVLFVDRSDTAAAQIAVALLASYARGRVQATSAGVSPGQVVTPETVQALAEMDIDASAAFPKPITEDAVHGADLVVLLADLAEPAGLTEPADAVPGRGHVVRWETPDLDHAEYAEYAEMQAGRDALDCRVLHAPARGPSY